MHSFSVSPLQPLIRKLQLWAPLSPADKSALCALPYTVRSLKAEHYLVRDGDRHSALDGDRMKHFCFLIHGFAHREKIVGDGGKQIFSLYMDGDVIQLQNSWLGRADHNIQMLADGEIALIPFDAIQKITTDHPAIGMAMRYDTLVEGSIFREWIANIGRRDAHARIAHLLCELAMRLEVAGLGNKNGYQLPMSQEWMADALALTPVHVSRILKTLQDEALIDRTKRRIAITNWDGLAAAGDFNPAYLHLDHAPPTAIGG